MQAQILNLLLDLQNELSLTYLFVAHDLSVVKHISDRVAVMYVGQMVELADRDTIFSAPKHPYTSALLSAVPRPDPRSRAKRITLLGEVANPAAPPSGCYFHPRCQFAVDRARPRHRSGSRRRLATGSAATAPTSSTCPASTRTEHDRMSPHP